MIYDLIRLRCQRKDGNRWRTVKVFYTEDEALDWYFHETVYAFPIRIIAEGSLDLGSLEVFHG